MATLTRDELERYARHLTLPEVGLAGQLRLRQGSVLLVGAGGLGSPAALYLAAAGVGRLGIADDDVVGRSNLQRQVLYGERDVGARKVAAAAARLADLNPGVRVVTHDVRLARANARALVASYDVVIDGSDNFPTRYLLSDACVLGGRPLVYGSVYRFFGQVTVFDAARGPCYRCLFPEPPPPALAPSCAEGGVLGVLPGIIGALQATEALKLLLGVGEPLVGRLVAFDALAGRFSEYRVHKGEDCAACGPRPSVTDLIDYEEYCGAGAAAGGFDLTPGEAAARRARGELLFLDVREPPEWNLCRIEGSTLIPLAELPARVSEVERRAAVAVYCHVGVRSRAAVELLRAAGFDNVYNLAGGIDAWSVQVDGGVPRY